MAGRRARSTVTPTAYTTAPGPGGVRYRNESTVLRPYLDIHNRDRAPIFVLEEAIIYEKDGKTIANLLEASVKGPFILRGKLVIDSAVARQYCVVPNFESGYIEVPECWTYSIGWKDKDDEDVEGVQSVGPCIWAYAKAGWMDLHPARTYRPIYDKMMEGVTLYYKIMVTYEEIAGHKKAAVARQAQANTPLDTIFYRYALGAGDGVLRREMEQRCDSHALFLLDQFGKDAGFNWTCCRFYSWMRQRHPDLQRTLDAAQEKMNQANMAGLTAQSVATAESHRIKSETDQDSTGSPPSAEAKRRTRSSRSRSAKPQDSETDVVMSDAPGQNASVPQTRTPLASSDQTAAFSSGSKKPAPFTLPLEAPLKAVLEAPLEAHLKAPLEAPLKAPLEALPLLIEVLEEILTQPPGPFKQSFAGYSSKVYTRCKIRDHRAAKEIIRLFAPALLQNMNRAKWKGTPFWAGLEADAAQPLTVLEFIRLEDIPSSVVRRRKTGKSQATAHQAADTKGSKSPTSTSTPTPRMATPSRETKARLFSGKTPGLRLSTARKRPLEEGDEVGSDRSGSVGVSKENLVENEHESESGLESDSKSADGTTGVSKVVFRAYPLQNDRPKGPRGTWVCENPGCGFVIRSATEPEQKKMVYDHMSQHTEKSMLVSQAEEEGKLNGLPIQNLLDKIMKESETRKTKLSKTQRVDVPERIKRVGLGW